MSADADVYYTSVDTGAVLFQFSRNPQFITTGTVLIEINDI